MSETTARDDADLVVENSLILDVLRGRPTPEEVQALSAALRTAIRASQRQRTRLTGTVPVPRPAEPAGSWRAGPGHPRA